MVSELTIYNKILATINSCRTQVHIDSTRNLINNYHTMFPDNFEYYNTFQTQLKKRQYVIDNDPLEGEHVVCISNGHI